VFSQVYRYVFSILCVNKAIIIGIVIIVVITIGIASSLSSGDTEDKDEILMSEEDSSLEEIISIEEDLEEEPEQTGRNLTVELTESVGIKSP